MADNTIEKYAEDVVKTKERIRKILGPWLDELGLKWWTVHIIYDALKRDGSPKCAGTADVDWQYMEASITFHLPKLLDEKDDELEQVVLHELMHILVHEMREWARDAGPDGYDRCRAHEERVVTTLTKAFIWVRDAARDGRWGPPRKKETMTDAASV